MLRDSPIYTQEEVELYSKLEGKERSSRWVELPAGCIFIPEALGRDLILQIHQGTHLGGTKLIELLERDYYILKLQQTAKGVSSWCHTCAQVNPGPPKEIQQGVRLCEQAPGELWELDFTKVSPGA